VNFNINSTSSNQKFKVQLSGNYLIDDNHLPGTDFTTTALQTAPDAPALDNLDGSLNWAPKPGWQFFLDKSTQSFTAGIPE